MSQNLLDILKKRKLFKLVLGLGNQSVEEIKYYTKIYASAGCEFFDVNASKDSIEALLESAKSAGVERPLICISIGLEGDTHTKKARIIEEKCKMCGKCQKACPQEAIKIRADGLPAVSSEKCIGCKKCKCKAIEYYGEGSDLKEAVSLAYEYKAHCVELHISTKKPPMKAIKYLIKNIECPLSLCIDREYYSNDKIKRLIKRIIKVNGSPEFIIQADGVPMSGSDDDHKSTLQSVAMAHLVEEFGCYVFLSGGTNSKTASLAEQCGVKFQGVSIGSYARKIVKNIPYEEAVRKAIELIGANIS